MRDPCCGGKSSGSASPLAAWLASWLTSVAGGAAEREEEEGEQGGMNGRGRRRRPLHRDFCSERDLWPSRLTADGRRPTLPPSAALNSLSSFSSQVLFCRLLPHNDGVTWRCGDDHKGRKGNVTLGRQHFMPRALDRGRSGGWDVRISQGTTMQGGRMHRN